MISLNIQRIANGFLVDTGRSLNSRGESTTFFPDVAAIAESLEGLFEDVERQEREYRDSIRSAANPGASLGVAQSLVGDQLAARMRP